MTSTLSKFTKYLHPKLTIGKGIHGNGLICNDFISMGSILVIESGIFNMQNTPNDQEMESLVNRNKNDADIRKVFDTLYYNNSVKSFYNTDDIDIQRYILNCIGGDIFPITSIMNHGYPTNCVHFRGRSDYARNQRIIFATDDINKNDEIVFDYFNIVSITNTDDSLDRFNDNRKIHNFEIDQSILDDFVAKTGKYNYINAHSITDEKNYRAYFNRVVKDIYLNGIFSTGHLPEVDENRIDKTKSTIKEIMFEIQSRLYGCFMDEKAANVFKDECTVEDIASYHDALDKFRSKQDQDSFEQLYKKMTDLC